VTKMEAICQDDCYQMLQFLGNGTTIAQLK